MRSSGERSAQRAGFTLLEIVVAMAIVGLGVVTLLQIFSAGLRLGARSSGQTETSATARQIMDEVLTRQDIEEGAHQGDFQGNGRWQLHIQRVNAADRRLALGLNWELKEVTLTIRLIEMGREREVELKTLRLARTSGQ